MAIASRASCAPRSRRIRCRVASPVTTRASHVEQKVHDVAVLDDVLLAFHPQLTGGLDRGLVVVSLEVLDGVDLRADEALLEVGMDHTRRLRCGRTLADGPRADLLLAGREVRLQSEQAVTLARETRQRGLGQTVRAEQLAAI